MILVPVDAAPLGGDEHEGEQRERRRVVHRARDLADVDAFEAAVHVVGVVDDDAAGAEQLGLDRVHVVAAVDRVARDQRDRGRAALEEAEQALVVVGRRAEADELALRPGAAAVHGRVDAARVVGLAGIAERLVAARRGAVGGGVERLDRDARDVGDLAVVGDAGAELALPALVRRLASSARSWASIGLFMSCVLRVGAARAPRLARVGAHARRDVVHRAARMEHLAHAALDQHRLLVVGNDAADDDAHVAEARLAQRRHQLGDDEVVGRERRDADDVDVFLERQLHDRRDALPRRRVDHLHAGVAAGGGDDAAAAVVAVEADLGDQHARPERSSSFMRSSAFIGARRPGSSSAGRRSGARSARAWRRGRRGTRSGSS